MYISGVNYIYIHMYGYIKIKKIHNIDINRPAFITAYKSSQRL